MSGGAHRADGIRETSTAMRARLSAEREAAAAAARAERHPDAAAAVTERFQLDEQHAGELVRDDAGYAISEADRVARGADTAAVAERFGPGVWQGGDGADELDRGGSDPDRPWM